MFTFHRDFSSWQIKEISLKQLAERWLDSWVEMVSCTIETEFFYPAFLQLLGIPKNSTSCVVGRLVEFEFRLVKADFLTMEVEF